MTLIEWSDEQDKVLPESCKCGRKLDQIRYVHEKDVTRIHLTGAVNEYECYRALCPSCDRKLAEHGLGTRHIR